MTLTVTRTWPHKVWRQQSATLCAAIVSIAALLMISASTAIATPRDAQLVSSVAADTALQRATIVVEDLDEAIAFYRDVLGLPLVRVLELQRSSTRESLGLPDSARVRFATLGPDENSPGQLGLLEITDTQVASAQLPEPPRVAYGQLLLVWRIDDAAAARERVLAAGATLITDIKPFSNRPGREFVIAAPDGTRIQLVELGD